MDDATLQYVRKHRGKLQGKVLEVGSLDVNGSVRSVIEVTVGIDMREGVGVDLVCPVNDLPKHYPIGYFDACVSVGTLEHVQDWREFVHVTWDMVKNGGFLVITMASLMKKRHAYPDDYWRMTEEQIRTIYPRLEDYKTLGKTGERYASVGWVVKKEGELGSLDFEPIKVP